jgi:tetratricopeptide (TPR) repeat protein
MDKFLLCSLLFSLFAGAFAQNSSIQEKPQSLNSYPYSDPDPVAAPGRIYPYFRFDGYTAEGRKMDWNMVEMENPYIKIYVSPQVGGKVWGAVEKSTGKEFLYFNHAVKFRDVAMRGAWTSGGVEFNFGLIGHAPSCSSPVDYLTRTNADGSISCFVGSTDLPSGTRWRVEINVPKDKAYFTTRSFWYNPSTLEQSYYHWTNAGIKVAGDLEYAYPGQYYLGHDGSNKPWPVNDEGRDLSFYENNNFEGYKSYHVFGEYTGFYGGYWHNDEFGTGHYAAYDEKPGKKLWIWGLSRQGMIWEDLLTDTDGQYTEIQSGRLFNQEASNSTLTPFKHRSFIPGGTDTWTEYWFPVKGTKGLKYGTPDGSVNLVAKGKQLNIWFSPLAATNEKLKIFQDNTLIWEKQLSLAPMQLFADSIPFNGNVDKLKVVLGEGKVLYTTDRKELQLSRPVEMPADFDWNSLYGQYLQGKEWDKQRSWADAEKCYLNCLEKDPNYLPALTAMANLSIRGAEFETALKYSSKALSIDTYEPAANFAYGVANARLKKYTDAIDGFSIASASIEYRAASYLEMAKIFMLQKQYDQAWNYALKATESNPLEVPAYELLATLARLDGNKDAANKYLSQLEALDPLDHLTRFEKYLLNPSKTTADAFTGMIRTELTHEVYLELATWYLNLGLEKDVASLLDLAPQQPEKLYGQANTKGGPIALRYVGEQPEILYWRAWLADKANNKALSTLLLNKANAGDPSLVFPYLQESIEPLTWAMNNSTSWKPAYYLGLIYWNSNKIEKAKSLFIKCGDAPDFYPFYLARVELFKSSDAVATEKDLLKAVSLAPETWRAGLELSRFYEKQKQTAKAKEVAASFFEKLPQNYYLGLNLAKQLSLNNEPEACVNLLANLKVLPNEGATAGYHLWRESNLMVTMETYSAKNYKKALKFITQSRTWPENLGVGKPYDVDERFPNFLESLCYNALGNKKNMATLESKITSFIQNKTYNPTGSTDLLSAWLLRKSGDKTKADGLVETLKKQKAGTKSTRWVEAMYTGNKNLATSIGNENDTVKNVDPYAPVEVDNDLSLMIRLSTLFNF